MNSAPRRPEQERDLRDKYERALRYDSGNLHAITRLAQLAAGDDDVARQANAMLEPMVDEHKAPAETHFVLGTSALLDEDYAVAIQHLERANELRPHTGEFLNNLAWAFAHKEPPELERALSFSNKAAS